MMTLQDSLTHLTAEVTQLRQQLEQVNQRLDMIYGAVTRLAGTGQPEPVFQKKSAAGAGLLSAATMMDPGSMLNSLRQYAQNAGLTIPPESIERLQADLPGHET